MNLQEGFRYLNNFILMSFNVYGSVMNDGSVLCIIHVPICSSNHIWKWILALIRTACHLGIAQWKNLVSGSDCNTTQVLLNGGWSMRISPRKPKYPTFCVRNFFEYLPIACTKTFTTELMDVSGLWDMNEKKKSCSIFWPLSGVL